LVARAIINIQIAPPNMARSIIGFRPTRSAREPQMGDTIIIAIAGAPINQPDQRATCSMSVIPHSFT